MRRLSVFFYRISNGWVALLGAAVFVLFSVTVLPVESARMDAYAQGLGSPDTSFIYNGKALLKMAEVYGEEGRSAFLTARWGFDLAFPLIFTFFFITSISFVYKKALGRTSHLPLINLIPLLGLIFDLAENTASSVVMVAYPLVGTWGQFMAPIFTPIKWIFVAINMFLLFIGLLLWVKNRISTRLSN